MKRLLLLCGTFAFTTMLGAGCSSDRPDDASEHHATYRAWPSGLVAEPDGSALYVAAGARIEKRDAQGSDPVTLADGEPADPSSSGRGIGARSLSLHGAHLYWTRWPLGADADSLSSSGPNILVRTPTRGGAVEVLATSGAAPFVRTIVVDDGVYACSNAAVGESRATLSYVALDGAQAPPRLVSTPLDGQTCQALFADASGVHLSLTTLEAGPRWFDASRTDVRAALQERIEEGVAWASDALILTRPDGSQVKLVTGSPRPVFFDGRIAYFKSGIGGGNRGTHLCETGEVSAVSEGQPARVIAQSQCSPSAFAVTASRVFWLDDQSLLNEDDSAETVLKSVERAR